MEPITIKKYSNRRLYHTLTKQYITLEDLEGIIREGAEVRVVDNQTKEDITQETLLQIILAGEKPRKIFTAELLHQLIRLHEEHFQEFFRFYLTSSMDYFSKFKQTMSQQFDTWKSLWGSLWLGPHKSSPSSGGTASGDSEEDPSAKVPEEFLAHLQERMQEYERKIRELEERVKKESTDSSEK